jgi:hypothetical protein
MHVCVFQFPTVACASMDQVHVDFAVRHEKVKVILLGRKKEESTRQRLQARPTYRILCQESGEICWTGRCEGMSNRGSDMLLPHINTNLKNKWSNRCEEYWSNLWHFLVSLKAALVSLFFSHLFPPSSLFVLKRQPPAEETASPKVYHPSLNWTIQT